MIASSPGIPARAMLARASSGLLWTEHWYLLAAVTAAVVAVDPLNWGLASEMVVKHLALAISLPAIVLTYWGTRLRTSRRQAIPTASLASLFWPLLLLAALIVAGSLYARLIQDVQSTFLNVGLYMFMAFGAAAMVSKSHDPEALLRGYVYILLAAAAVMSGYLIANFGVRQVYHEQIFLVIPLAVLFFARQKGSLVRWAGCLFFLAMAWLSAKYTSYLIGALTVAYLALAVTVPRLAPLPGLRRTMLIYWTLLAAGLVTVGFAYLGFRGMLDLPTGNIDYRSHTYALAWERFLDSPLWGTLFSVEAVGKFTLYATGVSNNMLATHSDVLDLLANGGLLGIGLWMYELARAARVAHANVLHPKLLDRSWAPHAHTLAAMSAAGVVTYAFNPILLQPSLAYLLWTSFGMLVGFALRAGAVRKGISA
ncbi:MAG: hypothetical protein HY322_06575 [Betaproteobacteria bacterium]|nr:hypothetical protein [Betaproteobacteria bacterium]